MFMYHINISGALRPQYLYSNITLVQQHSGIFVHKHLEAAGLSIYIPPGNLASLTQHERGPNLITEIFV